MSRKKDGFDFKIDQAVLANANLSKETIKEWMTRDIRGIFILVSDVLGSPECIDALTEIFWKRYQELHEKAKAEPELPFHENGNESGV